MRTPLAAAALLLLASSTALAEEASLDLGGGVSLPIVKIPGGAFQQGSAAGEPGHAPDEGRRGVTLSRPFWLGKTKVSVAQFRRFADAAGYKTEAEEGSSGGFGLRGGELVQDRSFTWRSPGFAQADDHPVVLVTLGDALAFTRWASQVTGREVALPTEAEWERGARGGQTTLFPWGDGERDAAANARFADRPPGTRSPTEGKPNGFGLLDVAGNAWEWTSDFHGPIAPGDVTDPVVSQGVTWEHSDKPRRVLKGGSWHTKDPWKLRPAARNRATDGSRNADFGFRVRVSDDPPKPAALVAPPPRPAPASRPAQPPPAPPSGGCRFGFVAAALGAAIAALSALALLVRRGGSRPSSPARGGGGSLYPTRVARDGFYIDAPARAAGESVRWRALVAGKQQNGVVTLVAGATFVYTGQPPLHAVVAGRAYTGGSDDADTGPDSGPDSGPSPQPFYGSSGSSGGSGWPSAY